MRFEDFVRDDDFIITVPINPTYQERYSKVVVEMHKTYCACHWKEVWVSEAEPLPYLCFKRKELPSSANL